MNMQLKDTTLQNMICAVKFFMQLINTITKNYFKEVEIIKVAQAEYKNGSKRNSV